MSLHLSGWLMHLTHRPHNGIQLTAVPDLDHLNRLCKPKEQSSLASTKAQDKLRLKRQTKERGMATTTMLGRHLSACRLVGMTVSTCTAADLLRV